MKLIIIEGGDQLGKSSLIKELCEYFNYDNITIRHFGKPPKGMSPEETLRFQFKKFRSEIKLYNSFLNRENDYQYYENIMIWNRSHLGEYVYSTLFRNANPDVVKRKIINLEKAFTSHIVYLITLTADPEFFLNIDDGKSFSQNLIDKTKEINLFTEVHQFSTIPYKLLVKVDDKGKFRKKEDIFNEVVQFLEKTK